MSNLFLDIDRADSVFTLLFAFLVDEVCEDEDLISFKDVVLEIVQGVRLPDDILEKLHRVYISVQQNPVDLYSQALRVNRTFEEDRSVVIALVSMLLRLTVNDGIICKKVRKRLLSILPAFEMTKDELQGLPDELLEVLEYAAEHTELEARSAIVGSLSGWYEVLGCIESNSDDEIRSAYRKLIKEYHPDTRAAEALSAQVMKSRRKQFDKIQEAFEMISRSRQGVTTNAL
jgi:DnaJ like chaperone protein